MKLPNVEAAIIEEMKIVGYLLNPVHRFGASKTKFFNAYGFHLDSWEVLASALRVHGESHEVIRIQESDFGARFEVEGELVAPDGRRPRLRTVWQIDHGQVAPRLITAYPLES